MKLPSLKLCLMALVGRFAGQSAPTAYNNLPNGVKPRSLGFTGKKIRVPKTKRAVGRMFLNQRQIRKNARRANAAGHRNAFA